MPNYATVSDISDYLNFNQPSGFFGGWSSDGGWRSFPSSGQVAARLNMVEKYIDQQTRNSWTTQTVTNEMHDFFYYRWHGTRHRYFYEEGSVHLRFFPIKTFSSAAGDKIEVYTAQTANDGYEDFLVTRTQGRNDDFWVDSNEGRIVFKNARPYRYRDAVRITYRYGESTVPEDIKYAAVLLTAAQIVSTEDYSVIMADGADKIPFRDKAAMWKEEADNILSYRTRLIFENE